MENYCRELVGTQGRMFLVWYQYEWWIDITPFSSSFSISVMFSMTSLLSLAIPNDQFQRQLSSSTCSNKNHTFDSQLSIDDQLQWPSPICQTVTNNHTGRRHFWKPPLVTKLWQSLSTTTTFNDYIWRRPPSIIIFQWPPLVFNSMQLSTPSIICNN